MLAKASIYDFYRQKVVDGRLRGNDGLLKPTPAQTIKSFLLLFFKKVALSVYGLVSKSIRGSITVYRKSPMICITRPARV